jgi:hypothetical protein
LQARRCLFFPLPSHVGRPLLFSGLNESWSLLWNYGCSGGERDYGTGARGCSLQRRLKGKSRHCWLGGDPEHPSTMVAMART